LLTDNSNDVIVQYVA